MIVVNIFGCSFFVLYIRGYFCVRYGLFFRYFLKEVVLKNQNIDYIQCDCCICNIKNWFKKYYFFFVLKRYLFRKYIIDKWEVKYIYYFVVQEFGVFVFFWKQFSYFFVKMIGRKDQFVESIIEDIV